MTDIESLFLVYNKQDFEEQSSFFALYLFSSNGEVAKDQIIKSYENEIDTWRLGESEKRIGPFVDMEAMHRFSFSLCQRVNADQISLLNIDSYNEAISKSSNHAELVENFLKEGDKIQNLEGGSKKGFLGRIFH